MEEFSKESRMKFQSCERSVSEFYESIGWKDSETWGSR